MPEEAEDTTEDEPEEVAPAANTPEEDELDDDDEAPARPAGERERGRRGRRDEGGGGARAEETPGERELRELRRQARELEEAAEQPKALEKARQRVVELTRDRARTEAAATEAVAKERARLAEEEYLRAERGERGELIRQELEEAGQAFEERSYQFGKEHHLLIAKSPAAKEGDLVRVEILDSDGRTVLDLQELLPRGTKLVASTDFALYDREADAVPVPVLDPAFGRKADRGLMGVIHEIVHAQKRDEPSERNRIIAEAHAAAEYERFRSGPQTPRDKARLGMADRRAAELRAASEQAAWEGTRSLVLELRKEKQLDVVPGYGEWPAREGEMKPEVQKKIREMLLRVEATYLAAPDEKGRSRFTGEPIAQRLSEVDLGTLRKGWAKRGLVGFLAYFFVIPAILGREFFGWVKRGVTGEKKKEGGEKKGGGGGGKPAGGGRKGGKH